MSSLVCGLDVHKDSIYATVMNYGGEIIDKRKLTNDEIANFLSRYPIDRVAMESSTSIVPVYRALQGKGYEILVSHPKKTRLVAESRIKTDRVDSWAVTKPLYSVEYIVGPHDSKDLTRSRHQDAGVGPDRYHCWRWGGGDIRVRDVSSPG